MKRTIFRLVMHGDMANPPPGYTHRVRYILSVFSFKIKLHPFIKRREIFIILWISRINVLCMTSNKTISSCYKMHCSVIKLHCSTEVSLRKQSNSTQLNIYNYPHLVIKSCAFKNQCLG